MISRLAPILLTLAVFTTPQTEPGQPPPRGAPLSTTRFEQLSLAADAMMPRAVVWPDLSGGRMTAGV
jgi:hypothetical protein